MNLIYKLWTIIIRIIILICFTAAKVIAEESPDFVFILQF